MSDLALQASFNSGEWAPALAARVDLQKYRAGAALLENFFVDYRGGASTRPGTKYVLQAYKSANQVRLIPFQAAFNIGYALEFGSGYIRFYYQGSPVLEDALDISGATNANPCVLTITAHDYNIGDWIFVDSVGGMTQLNGNYYSISATTTNTVTLADLNGNAIDSTSYGTYTTGGTVQRVYTLESVYTVSDDLELIKFAQSTNEMILCHPNHPPYALTLISATDWTLLPVQIGTTIGPPTGVAVTSTLSSGSVNYSYGVSSIDANGQESSITTAALAGYQDIRSVAGSNKVAWTALEGAVAYNVYESDVSYFGVVPSGVQYGFIGTTTGVSFIDSNIGPDYTQTPQISENPFQGAGVTSVAVTNDGAGYTSVPSVTFSGGTPTTPATAIAPLSVTAATIDDPGAGHPGGGYRVGDLIYLPYGIVIGVTAVTYVSMGNYYYVSGIEIINSGSLSAGSTPSNPVAQIGTSGVGFSFSANLTWGVQLVQITSPGAGYLSTPTVVFSSGSAAATATIGSASSGYPQVPGFFQQRLVLAATSGAPQTLNLSQPGNYFNFNITNPSQADNAISGTLVSGVLSTIKSIVASTAGMLVLTDKASWLVNGGSSGSDVTPSAFVANPQSYVGATDVPPIVANYDVLYVQSKGSGIRDLAFNIYFNVFTGTDISILSSHLFFGYTINEWAWAEEPFYVVWAVRSDGVMLTLTFLKEQDFIGWSHQVTAGSFMSVCAVTEETTDAGTVDAIYTVVERVVNGNTVQYIERVADRIFPNGVEDAWCVDAGLQYSGSPATSFTGAQHLAGMTVTGLADGNVITPFVMPVDGDFTLPFAASLVTIGLGFTAQLQTLALDIQGEQTQGKVKKIPYVDVRVNDTLGLDIGPDFDHLTPMKDLVVGNVSSMLTGQESQQVSGLYSGDARTYLPNSAYTVPGQYCIQQSLPLPASILGVFPAFAIGDDQ